MSYPGYSSIFNPRNNVHARTVHFYWEKLLTFTLHHEIVLFRAFVPI